MIVIVRNDVRIGALETKLEIISDYVLFCYNITYSFLLPGLTQVGVVSVEKVVPSVQVIVLLPLSRNPSSHVTVSSAPAYTGNVVVVLILFQAGFRLVHWTVVPVGRVRIERI